ncbi:MAG TPA: hypothetical protein VI815_00185 [Candidatus Nanoarchaeia archaeon]|nr:hypothetical protein [Candidatus Nanoarchaeia archaeon]
MPVLKDSSIGEYEHSILIPFLFPFVVSSFSILPLNKPANWFVGNSYSIYIINHF